MARIGSRSWSARHLPGPPARPHGAQASGPAAPPAKGVATKQRDVGREPRLNFFARVRRFLREVVAELRKVIWPARNQMITYTIVVIVFVTFMVALTAGLDVLVRQDSADGLRLIGPRIPVPLRDCAAARISTLVSALCFVVFKPDEEVTSTVSSPVDSTGDVEAIDDSSIDVLPTDETVGDAEPARR